MSSLSPERMAAVTVSRMGTMLLVPRYFRTGSTGTLGRLVHLDERDEGGCALRLLRAGDIDTLDVLVADLEVPVHQGHDIGVRIATDGPRLSSKRLVPFPVARRPLLR